MIENISGFSVSSETKSLSVNHSNISSPTILVIDDSRLSRMTAVDLLLLDGYKVIESDGESEIVESILKEKPDLVLLDVVLNQINGFDICKQLKQDIRTKNVPVVLMTVAERREYRRKIAESGADDFLSKPLDRYELLSRVKTLIKQKRLNEGIGQTEQVLFSIAQAVENRTSDRGSSSEETGTFIAKFARYLELTAEDTENLVFAANIHNIGSIGIPDSVMLKEGKLTEEEKELIRQHVLVGEQICKPLTNRQGVLPIIRHHHERWDGSGYPDGLKSDRIPYLAQVFQIIDIYQALIGDRPHKKAYTSQEALNIIEEETAKGWRNPELVSKFKSFINALSVTKNIENE